MILLDLNNPFTFTLRDQDGNETELKGTFREYTRQEQKDAKDKYTKLLTVAEDLQKIGRKIARNERQIEIKEKLEDYKAVDKLVTATNKLEDELEALGATVDKDSGDNSLKERFNVCLGGDQKDEIIELAENVGYQTVYAKIIEGLTAGKPKG